MGLLQQIERGKSHRPPRIMAYGIEGIGKSTLAAGAPHPVFIQTEDGLGEIDCDKFPLSKSLDEVLALLAALASEPHDYETVVLDSLDWLEQLLWDALCEQYRVSSIEKVDGGYGKGYIYALSSWRKILAALETLHRERGMIIFLIAHAKVERFDDPESPAYDRYSPRLHKHASALITEWCDAVLFATRRIRVQTESAGFNRERGVAHAVGKDGGERILRTIGGPACVAKNRYNLPGELPLSWNSLMHAILATDQTTDSPTLPATGESVHG